MNFSQEFLKKNVRGVKETVTTAKVLFESAEELRPRMKAVLKSKELDSNIKVEDIALLFHNGTPNYIGKVIKTSKCYLALGLPPLAIIIHRDVWKDFDQGKKNLLLLHELRHVVKTEEKGYRLIRHDIEDFQIILEQAGLNWEHSKSFEELYNDD